MVYQDSARCPDHCIISGGRGSAAPFHEARFGRGTQRGRRVVSRDCSDRIPGPIGPSRDERCPWGPGATGSAGPCGRPRKSRLRGAGLLGPERERARGSRLGRPEPRWPRERQRLHGPPGASGSAGAGGADGAGRTYRPPRTIGISGSDGPTGSSRGHRPSRSNGCARATGAAGARGCGVRTTRVRENGARQRRFRRRVHIDDHRRGRARFDWIPHQHERSQGRTLHERCVHGRDVHDLRRRARGRFHFRCDRSRWSRIDQLPRRCRRRPQGRTLLERRLYRGDPYRTRHPWERGRLYLGNDRHGRAGTDQLPRRLERGPQGGTLLERPVLHGEPEHT